MKEDRSTEWKSAVSYLYFESLPCRMDTLTFDYFSEKLRERMGVPEASPDVLRTLGFLTDQKEWNNAAALFSDQNAFSGIDMARFGENISVILDRETFSGMSILEQYDRAVGMFRRYYQYEEIAGIDRVTKELVPEMAFREAVANALVHRTWDINACIRISMFADRIEISSPGGLPNGITEEEYLNGNISSLRNPVIANVFFRMRYIEMFGTGIRRIRESYRNLLRVPEFRITDNTVTVILPVQQGAFSVSPDEEKVLNLFRGGRSLSSNETAEALGWSRDKSIRLLNALIDKDYVKTTGNGRSTRYSLR